MCWFIAIDLLREIQVNVRPSAADVSCCLATMRANVAQADVQVKGCKAISTFSDVDAELVRSNVRVCQNPHEQKSRLSWYLHMFTNAVKM
jgi:hypothetical protein